MTLAERLTLPYRSAGLGRTWLFHPWGREPEGGWSGSDVSVSHVVRHRQGSGFDGLGWVPLGPKRARQGPVWSRMGPYISRTLIRDSRVIRQGPSGPVGSYRVPTGFRRNTDLARHHPTLGRQVSTDRSTVPCWCTIGDQVLVPFGYFGYQGFGPPRPLIW